MRAQTLLGAGLVTALALNLTTSPVSAQSEIRINEVLANSASFAYNGTVTDWVELYNTGLTEVNLGGASLSDTFTNALKYVIPAGVRIPAQGFLVIRLNGSAPATTNNAGNAGFGLKSNGDTLYYFAPGGALVDSVQFGIQMPDKPIGRMPDGIGVWTLNNPTPGRTNAQVQLGDVGGLRINEWMASPNNGSDWFEVYNSSSQPVALGGLYFADFPLDPLIDPTPYRVRDLSFIGGGTDHAFLKMVADNHPNDGADHVNFKLSANGDSIYLYNTDAFTLIHAITFGPQTTDVSEGLQPDGSTNVVRFKFPSPGERNLGRMTDLPIITNVIINELLAHTDPPLEDALELYNPTDSPVDIGGWYLGGQEQWAGEEPTVDVATKWRIPAGTIIQPYGYKVFYERRSLGGFGDKFRYNSAHGGTAWLTQADTNGTPTAVQYQDYDSSFNGVSFGRYVTIDGQAHFVSMRRRTFGQDNPTTLDQFRLGTGLRNSEPTVGPIVINEIMYHPPDIGTNDNTVDEYIELYNLSTVSVPLYDPNYPTNRWKLKKAVDYVFPVNVSMPPNSYLLVVSFDPATNAAQKASFLQTYGLPATARLFGPYQGKLENNGEAIELYRPDTPQGANHPEDFGFVPYVMADRVRYGDTLPWPFEPDGSGMSLQKKVSNRFGDDPANWKADWPTAGKVNGFAPVIQVQPQAPAWVYAGDTVTLDVTVSGTAPFTNQWRRNGLALAGATGSSLTVSNIGAANAGDYTVVIRNLAGAVTSAVARIQGDFVRPTVSITSPLAGAIVPSDAEPIVRGRAGDQRAVEKVLISVNNGAYEPATGTTNWSCLVSYAPGTNIIRAKSVDFGRNESTQAVVRIRYIVRSPLALSLSGGGIVTGVTNGQMLVVGNPYTAVAKPAAGYLFGGWSGDLSSSSPTLRFIMQSNLVHLVLKANFVPNPFIPVKGVYNGLFAGPVIMPANAGFFRLTLSQTGLFTGRLWLENTNYGFSGQFGLDLQSQTRVLRSGKTPLTLSLTLDDANKLISGSVSNDTWGANLSAALTAVFPAVAAYAGQYSWVIAGDAENPAASPGGDGVGTAIAGTNGTVTVSGTLGDGTALTHAAGLSQDGRLPVSVQLYSGRGLLLGWLDFSRTNLMTNSVAWVKPAMPANGLYPAGFAVERAFLGSRYIRPPLGRNVLDWTNGLVLIEAGNLAQALSNRVQVVNNLVQVLDGNPNRLTLKFAVTNGLLSGTFRNPQTLKTNTFKGAVLQLDGTGGGWFKGTNQTGFISVEPR